MMMGNDHRFHFLEIDPQLLGVCAERVGYTRIRQDLLAVTLNMQGQPVFRAQVFAALQPVVIN